jgi:hypothetical protein
MKRKTSRTREELLEPRAALHPSSLHITATNHDVVALTIQTDHRVDLAKIVRKIRHDHEHRAVLNLVESG